MREEPEKNLEFAQDRSILRRLSSDETANAYWRAQR